ncbi:hypothetical protein I4F81_003188 [Pyropia yezoensis]|uniref:Uncharacterized protein n=1 Tax=Pyropia yezoensis TaxID=2788 RepID=A0ACC3BS90_PYRYE|nr:hypothetical protein I4F81_003188 [Neopyropia yezoensis]
MGAPRRPPPPPPPFPPSSVRSPLLLCPRRVGRGEKEAQEGGGTMRARGRRIRRCHARARARAHGASFSFLVACCLFHALLPLPPHCARARRGGGMGWGWGVGGGGWGGGGWGGGGVEGGGKEDGGGAREARVSHAWSPPPPLPRLTPRLSSRRVDVRGRSRRAVGVVGGRRQGRRGRGWSRGTDDPTVAPPSSPTTAAAAALPWCGRWSAGWRNHRGGVITSPLPPLLLPIGGRCSALAVGRMVTRPHGSSLEGGGGGGGKKLVCYFSAMVWTGRGVPPPAMRPATPEKDNETRQGMRTTPPPTLVVTATAAAVAAAATVTRREKCPRPQPSGTTLPPTTAVAAVAVYSQRPLPPRVPWTRAAGERVRESAPPPPLPRCHRPQRSTATRPGTMRMESVVPLLSPPPPPPLPPPPPARASCRWTVSVRQSLRTGVGRGGMALGCRGSRATGVWGC